MSLVACNASGSDSGCCCRWGLPPNWRSWPSRLALVGLFTKAVAICVIKLRADSRSIECSDGADPPHLRDSERM